jgi:hypothetical protein
MVFTGDHTHHVEECEMHEAATVQAPPAAAAAQRDCPPSPTFAELRRCTWGTHVTVHGQPAKFHQAGLIDDRQVVIVLAGDNPVLAAESVYREPACDGESAYYFDYGQAHLSIGTPPAAPLLREQAAASLRAGDVVLLAGCPATFLELKSRAGELWLTLRAAPEQHDALRRIGAEQVDDAKWGQAWHVDWNAGLKLRLVSARLPTFTELSSLRPGACVTVGADGVPAWLQCTQVRDGTRRFVVVKAAPWLNLHQTQSQPAPGSRHWIYRIRFEEAGLRLADERIDDQFARRPGEELSALLP